MGQKNTQVPVLGDEHLKYRYLTSNEKSQPRQGNGDAPGNQPDNCVLTGPVSHVRQWIFSLDQDGNQSK